MALVYATRADLVNYAPVDISVPDEGEATRLLTSASKVIRRGTRTAIYDVDPAGMPTDAAIRQAFRDATCAQAVWWLDTGDERGVASQWQSMTIGGVTLSRGRSTSPAAATGQQLAPQAETELSDAGVLPGSVVAIYPWEGSWL